ncbi:MAG: hypothetical protein DME50_19080 [Verrucomicrobia bacterium]|nr:MAG: hypothetical protein DME50_19080 [Verrucomicrobiota bacterium]
MSTRDATKESVTPRRRFIRDKINATNTAPASYPAAASVTVKARLENLIRLRRMRSNGQAFKAGTQETYLFPGE